MYVYENIIEWKCIYNVLNEILNFLRYNEFMT